MNAKGMNSIVRTPKSQPRTINSPIMEGAGAAKRRRRFGSDEALRFRVPPQPSKAVSPLRSATALHKESPLLRFGKRLQSWMACPNLANPPEAIPGAKPNPAPPPPPPWPLPQGRAAEIGNGRKLTLHSVGNAFAISFRVADCGLLLEFSLWIAGYGLRITADCLDSYRWLRSKTSQSNPDL